MASSTARLPTAVVVGSLNLDEVFEVPHIAAEGETLSASKYTLHAGGKGANQSAALAKGGAKVYHCGRIGTDGEMLTQRMRAVGVCVEHVVVSPHEHTGRAIIQLSASSRDNAIVLFPGANHCLHINDVRASLVASAGHAGDWLVLQNEVRFSADEDGAAIRSLIEAAKSKDMLVAFSPAPYMADITELYPLDLVDVLVLNKHEARGLALMEEDRADGPELLDLICEQFPTVSLVVLTLGAEGFVARLRSGTAPPVHLQMPAAKLLQPLVDTTGAGDTFTGYLIAGLMRRAGQGHMLDKVHVEAALREAVVAGSMVCEHHGALDGVPLLEDVRKRIAQNVIDV